VDPNASGRRYASAVRPTLSHLTCLPSAEVVGAKVHELRVCEVACSEPMPSGRYRQRVVSLPKSRGETGTHYEVSPCQQTIGYMVGEDLL
jgi:hypothetical protein